LLFIPLPSDSSILSPSSETWGAVCIKRFAPGKSVKQIGNADKRITRNAGKSGLNSDVKLDAKWGRYVIELWTPKH